MSLHCGYVKWPPFFLFFLSFFSLCCINGQRRTHVRAGRAIEKNTALYIYLTENFFSLHKKKKTENFKISLGRYIFWPPLLQNIYILTPWNWKTKKIKKKNATSFCPLHIDPRIIRKFSVLNKSNYSKNNIKNL